MFEHSSLASALETSRCDTFVVTRPDKRIRSDAEKDGVYADRVVDRPVAHNQLLILEHARRMD